MLAAEILGGKEELQKRPLITLHTDTPGLTYGKKTSDRIQGCLDGWAKGIPLLTDFTDVCISGFMGPSTIVGSQAVVVAASIAEAVALSIHHPGKIPTMTYELIMPVDNYTQQSVGACNNAFDIGEALNAAYWHNVYSAPHASMWPSAGVASYANGQGAETQGGFQAAVTTRALIAGTDQIGVWSTLMSAIRPEGYAITAEYLRFLRRLFEDIDFSDKAFQLDKWIGKDPRGGFDEDEEVNADIIAISAMMTASMSYQGDVINKLKARGLRENYKVLVGGCPMTPAFAESIGADDWGADMADAVVKADLMMKER